MKEILRKNKLLVIPIIAILLLSSFFILYNAENLSSNKGLFTDPAKMTDAEREGYGIEAIPRNNLSARAAELNISEWIVKERLEGDEEVFYFACSGVVSSQSEMVELKRLTLTKNLLLEEFSEQIDRSELIIRAFSTEGVGHLEDSKAIVKKHTERLEFLLEFQKQLNAITETDLIELNDIFDSYLKIVFVDSAYYGKIIKNGLANQ